MGSVPSFAMPSQLKRNVPAPLAETAPRGNRELSTSTVGLARKLAGWRDTPQAAHKSKHDLSRRATLQEQSTTLSGA